MHRLLLAGCGMISTRMFWFRRLIQDPYFAHSMKCRWQELRSRLLTNEYFTNAIDSMATVLQEAQVRNFQRWPVLGIYVWPNQYVGQTYQDEINFLKQWTLARLAWMDQNMPGNCELVTAVNEDQSEMISVFPNPFFKSVTIRMNDTSGFDQIHIHDVMGKEMFAISFSGNEFVWNGTSSSGNPASTGIYFVTLIRSGKVIGREKIVLLSEQP